MNGTPALLLASLSMGLTARQGLGKVATKGTEPPLPTTTTTTAAATPLRVLDLCSSPGGKGLSVWDALVGSQNQDMELTLNDVSEKKLEAIRANLAKFQLEDSPKIRLNIGNGTNLQVGQGNITGGYDLIIIDTPCSNTGVLNRRVEARWR